MVQSSSWVQLADMAGVCKLEVTETETDLKQWLRSQKTASENKTYPTAVSAQDWADNYSLGLPTLLGHHRVTVQEWLLIYCTGGLAAMLTHSP
ncbi:hypothetical protein H6F76_08945 [Leptolyngbya sp. FACHB-321]|uniref:hypothetical protein n=1 Tax=Leptolyngbya sp. FACHB-321 TaxID=2692807 RepID=UPI001684926C|nr:hypothetical protein [Leptolyngbya sp. FACHB-321]MBD2035154.1 hypothetical protein [Leptolyngbya sp. FACHB-321]